MIDGASICGPLGSSSTYAAANQTRVVFCLSDTSTFGSINGLDKAARRTARSMSFHDGNFLTEYHDGYGYSFDKFHLPKLSLVARGPDPKVF